MGKLGSVGRSFFVFVSVCFVGFFCLFVCFCFCFFNHYKLFQSQMNAISREENTTINGIISYVGRKIFF